MRSVSFFFIRWKFVWGIKLRTPKKHGFSYASATAIATATTTITYDAAVSRCCYCHWMYCNTDLFVLFAFRFLLFVVREIKRRQKSKFAGLMGILFYLSCFLCAFIYAHFTLYQIHLYDGKESYEIKNCQKSRMCVVATVYRPIPYTSLFSSYHWHVLLWV